MLLENHLAFFLSVLRETDTVCHTGAENISVPFCAADDHKSKTADDHKSSALAKMQALFFCKAVFSKYYSYTGAEHKFLAIIFR